MTPLFRHPEPDDRPTPSEVIGAIILCIVALLALWTVGAINARFLEAIR